MKTMRIIFSAMIFLFAVFLVKQTIYAEGIVYLSNTNLTVDDNFVENQTGIMFETGTNAAGYKLDAVSILFETSTYSTADDGYIGFTLELLDRATSVTSGFSGNFTPTNAGLYVYTANSNTILTPNTSYLIGLSAGSENLNIPVMGLTADHYAATTNGGWSLINSYGNIFAIEATPIAPSLTITQVDQQITISWLSSSAGFILQTNNDSSTTNWGNYTGLITNNSVSIIPSSKSLFFRWQ